MKNKQNKDKQRKTQQNSKESNGKHGSRGKQTSAKKSKQKPMTIEISHQNQRSTQTVEHDRKQRKTWTPRVTTGNKGS